jgi:bifunctional DNase/RNase
MTHQLAYSMLQAFGGEMVRCEIVNLQNNTFYANLVVRRAGAPEQMRLDARPSDAIALALRARVPILVAEWVLEQVRAEADGPDPLPPPEEPDKPKE